jgi:hypothetical protein
MIDGARVFLIMVLMISVLGISATLLVACLSNYLSEYRKSHPLHRVATPVKLVTR